MAPENPSPSQPIKRILSGMRPTGKLHLGNYYGALYNWVQASRKITSATTSWPTGTP